MSKGIKVIAGLDIGNGYVKGKASFEGRKPLMIDMPSVISYTAVSNMPKVVTPEYIKGFDNEMDVTINSRSIKGFDVGRMFVGQRGIHSGGNLREFNIENTVPKCQDALSTILILSSLASAALRDYYELNGRLPDDNRLDIDACIGIALPIEDFMQWKDVYAQSLTSVDHDVIVHNFEQDITIRVHFSRVVPLAEGAAAQYAITNLGSKFLQLVLDDARAMGANIDPAYTGEVLASVENTLGIDIGEGNVNFPVFSNGSINVEASRSINKGYGTVLTEVINIVRNEQGMSFDSRKALADFMLEENLTPIKRKKKEKLQRVIDAQVVEFVRDVIREFTNIYRKVGVQLDVIYIYGGGAKDVQRVLYPALLAEVSDENGDTLPVIYLDSSYSRDLNRTGLYEVATVAASAIWNK